MALRYYYFYEYTVIVWLAVNYYSNLQGRNGPPGYLALARWAGWSAVLVNRHVRCLRRSNDFYHVNGER